MINKEDYADFESDVDYDTVLDDFEGPLDLLLHLININKINIEDIFVSKVTEQFLDYIEYMKTQPGRNVDKESEYLAMAAQILYIKSKSLLPPVEIEGEIVGGAEEEQEELIRQLKERELELIREKTVRLKEMETVGYFFKEPDKDIVKTKIVYKDFSMDDMLQAFAYMLLRNESLLREKDSFKEIPKDVYTVQDRVTYLRDKLLENDELKFEELFQTYTASEIITTFQALLEMLKFQYVTVRQDGAFGSITITKNADADLRNLGNEQFDEYN